MSFAPLPRAGVTCGMQRAASAIGRATPHLPRRLQVAVFSHNVTVGEEAAEDPINEGLLDDYKEGEPRFGARVGPAEAHEGQARPSGLQRRGASLFAQQRTEPTRPRAGGWFFRGSLVRPGTAST